MKKGCRTCSNSLSSCTSAKPAARRAGMCDRREQIPQVRGYHSRFAPKLAAHFTVHNGSKSRDSVPLRNPPAECAASPGLLKRGGLSDPSHNGSKSRDSVPLRNPPSRANRVSRPSEAWWPFRPEPQRQQIPRFSAVAESPSRANRVHRPSEAWWPFRPEPQRQQIPRFSAVAEFPSRANRVCRPSEAWWPFRPEPQRQQIPRFSAVAESPSCSILFRCPAGDIVFNEKELFARGGVRTK